MLIGGFLGVFLARIFEMIIFFLAGGIVALVLTRLWSGALTPQDLTNLETFRDALMASTPKCWEFIAFLIGGILYILNVRIILAITTSALGGLLIRWVWGDVLQDFHPYGHDLTAVFLMAIGTIVQMYTFKGRREILPPRYRQRRFND